MLAAESARSASIRPVGFAQLEPVVLDRVA